MRFLLSVMCMASLVLQPVAAFAQTTFPDMENAWFQQQDAVEYLVNKGIINGYDDGTFKPNAPINRAEFLKIVFKGHNVTKPARRCFSDVNPDDWYAPYVCAAKNRDIIQGYPDGTYKPDRTINFAEAIKIALGAYGRNLSDTSGEQWFMPYVDELDQNDILAKHSYIPWEEVSRVRAADLIWRLIRYDEEQFLAHLSKGCGKAKPSPPTSVTVYGTERQFLLTVPSNYVVHDPKPLVIAFHGRTNSNEQVRSYYRLDKELQDAFIVYPAAISNGNDTFAWSDPGNAPSELRDIALFDAIVETLASKYCIDLNKVYTVGHSLGGWFSNSLACVRGDVIRGSVSVGGSSVITDCSGPAAAMIIHNPEDRLAPFSGSERNRQQRVEQNGCNWELSSVSEELHCSSHKACFGGNEVLWCPHTNNIDSQGRYYPHNWPRSTATHIREFFESLR